MHATATLFILSHPGAILDRHDMRRNGGVPTLSIPVGPIRAGSSAWRSWAMASGHSAIGTNGSSLPTAKRVDSLAIRLHLIRDRILDALTGTPSGGHT
jgi:hypothetical protein